MLGAVDADAGGAGLGEEVFEGAAVEGGGTVLAGLSGGLEALDEAGGFVAGDAVIAFVIEGGGGHGNSWEGSQALRPPGLLMGLAWKRGF
jgi:hypothetical protein